jgi:ATP-dependent DNA helicase RecQ
MISPVSVLKKYYGYSQFRPNQEKIIRAILDRRSILAIMPTGGGKSICFQIPGIIFSGLTIVISPLISLMKDQVDQLNELNIKAIYLNSNLSPKELNDRLKRIKLNEFKFIYLAPERLENKKFLAICQFLKIDFLVIDEAHCLSMWGHDFRPSYLKILKFLENIKQNPVISAFTATASPEAQKDILNQLQIKKENLFLQSFIKDNLNIKVFNCESLWQKNIYLFKILKKHKEENGIIYVTTRKMAEKVSKIVNQMKLVKTKCGCYHGGLEASKKDEVQDDFLKNKVNLIVATNAFGMGINKTNINFIVHYQISANLENYYQEIGRAGRDHTEANCYLLYYHHDLLINLNFINNPAIIESRRNLLKQKLKKIWQYSQINFCRLNFILNYFGEKTNLSCKKCDNCLKNKSIEKIDQKFIKFISQMAKKNQTFSQKILNFDQFKLVELLKPIQKDDFLAIPGIGEGWMKKYYQEFRNYFQRNS